MRGAKWYRVLVGSTLLTLLAGGCAVGLRDAVISGVLDYVTSGTGSLLGQLFPVAGG